MNTEPTQDAHSLAIALRLARAQIRALQLQLAEKPKNEWQPIETAPKDGTEIIVGWDSATVWITRSAYYDNGMAVDIEGNPFPLWETQGFSSQAEAEGWWSPDNCVGTCKVEPTHWMPLPAPPMSDK